MSYLFPLIGIFPILSPYVAILLTIWGGVAHDRTIPR